jgi:hypothetical protein
VADQAAPRFKPVPWTGIATPQDAELWIEEHNLCMQELIAPNESGVGVCFELAAGGRLYLQTREDAIILDVDEEAEWMSPVIHAATGAEPPRGRVWVLPAHSLVQLIIGLSTLVASTVLVTGHRFGSRNF